jgi:cell division protein FtsL
VAAKAAPARLRPPAARPLRVGRPRRAASQRHAPLGSRALAYVRALPDHRLIDRLIHSRGWIPVLGLLLVGIVFMQVEVLKLNANMGRAIQTSTALQSRNELLRQSVATLSDGQRIESLAAKDLNMVMPAPNAPSFLSSPSSANVAAAIANIHAPDAAAFTAALPVTPVVAAVTTTTSSSTPTGG